MSGFGYGIGSFMEGLASGIRSGQAISARNKSDALDERRLQIQEDAARRDAENDAYTRSINEKKMKWAEEDRARNLENETADRAWQEKQNGWSEADRAANAPLVETKRKADILEQEGKLSGLKTEDDIRKIRESADPEYRALESKSIQLGKDEAGKPIYGVDGEKAASEEEARQIYEKKYPFNNFFVKNAVPKIVDGYLKAGQPEKAAAFEKWATDKRTDNGIEASGRAIQALELGDVNGLNKALNEIASDKNYLVKDGFSVSGEIIKGNNDEKGIRVKYKNKNTGAEFSNDLIGSEAVSNGLQFIFDPKNVFEFNIKSTELTKKQAAEANKKGVDTGADITKEAYKQMGEARQKLDDVEAPDWAKAMTPEQKDAYVAGRLKSMLNNKSIMPQQSGASQPRTFSYGR